MSSVRTWTLEASAVALVLATVALLGGNRLLEWIGALAVLLTFMHAQITDRLAEREATRPQPEVPCFRWAQRYFLSKEVLWLLYFVLHHSWSAMAGVVLFFALPRLATILAQTTPVSVCLKTSSIYTHA